MDVPNDSVKKPLVVRKKFAVPPVKVACLECRASRCRCDGAKPVCSNCTSKGRQCVYVQSKRGGSRIRKRKLSGDISVPPARNQDLNQAAHSILPKESHATFAGPLSFVTPGGGLRQLDLLPEDTEFIFDNTFSTSAVLDGGYGGTNDPALGSDISTPKLVPVRTYCFNEAILGAYYTYIHQYFPVFPAPSSDQIHDRPDFGVRRHEDSLFSSSRAPEWEPDTPLSLAISATLALIPHPEDPNPTGEESVKIRREQAKGLAQAAYSAIESESELDESNENPQEALCAEKEAVLRQPFHPRCPVRNENIIALLLLSTFEYAQRGNVTKMKIRAVQALTAAMDLGLHSKGVEDGHFAEADRRTWWMTYIMACQSAILSNSESPMQLYDHRFTTIYPSFGLSTEGWAQFIVAQQVITKATQFVINLDAALMTAEDPSHLWKQMLELDRVVEPLVAEAESWSSTQTIPLDSQEMVVKQALLGMARIKLNSARIKLHRRNAFSDIPVFTKKHCDLQPRNGKKGPGCGCSSLFNDSRQNSYDSTATLQSQQPVNTIFTPFPFDTKTSATIAYRCAFNIANSYSKLPLPQPRTSAGSQLLAPNGSFGQQLPRMMPIFSCCAMQSSYVIIMLYHRSMSVAGRHDEESNTKFLGHLAYGMKYVLEALKNYSIAYEAIGGMPEQIEDTMRRVGFQQV